NHLPYYTDLHHRTGRHAPSIQHRRHTNQPFAADRRDLDHPAILQDRQHRAEATAREVDVLERFAGFIENFFERERNDFEGWSEAFEILERKGRKQKILRLRWRWSVPRRRRSIRRASRGRSALGLHDNLHS